MPALENNQLLPALEDNQLLPASEDNQLLPILELVTECFRNELIMTISLLPGLELSWWRLS